MATVWRDQPVATGAERAWAALRVFGQADALFAPVLVGCTLDGDVRTVTFADGMTVKERLITRDEAHRRLAYCVLGDMFEEHGSSMQILPVDEGHCCFRWISDFLPDERAEMVSALVEQGAQAFARAVESGVSVDDAAVP